jgi:hypothetical protein
VGVPVDQSMMMGDMDFTKHRYYIIRRKFGTIFTLRLFCPRELSSVGRDSA